jgi:hypothetical protein
MGCVRTKKKKKIQTKTKQKETQIVCAFSNQRPEKEMALASDSSFPFLRPATRRYSQTPALFFHASFS